MLLFVCKILPEWSQHYGFHHAAITHHGLQFRFIHEVCLDLLCALLFGGSLIFNVSGYEMVASNDGTTGIGDTHSERLPFTTGITRFFKQFTLGRYQRAFTFIHHTGTQLKANLLHPMTILLLNDILTLSGYGNHIHPIGGLSNVEIWDNYTIW